MDFHLKRQVQAARERGAQPLVEVPPMDEQTRATTMRILRVAHAGGFDPVEDRDACSFSQRRCSTAATSASMPRLRLTGLAPDATGPSGSVMFVSDRVAAGVLANQAPHTPLLDDADQMTLVDVDDAVMATFGSTATTTDPGCS